MEHQQINDNLIIDICFQKNCNRYKRGFDFNKLPENIQQYILNRYNDSQSLRETLVVIMIYFCLIKLVEIIYVNIKYNLNIYKKNMDMKMYFNVTM